MAKVKGTKIFVVETSQNGVAAVALSATKAAQYVVKHIKKDASVAAIKADLLKMGWWRGDLETDGFERDEVTCSRHYAE